MEKLTQYFSDKFISKVLDVGTGPGHFIPVLEKAFPKASIVGVDPDTKALEEAEKTFPGYLFKEMPGEALDFENDNFDAACISMALHHVPDVQQTLKEMQRVVKPGGWIIVNELFSNDLNPAQEVHKSMHHFRSRIDRMKGVSHNETFTRHEILQQIKKAGLDIQFYFDDKKEATKPSATEIEERIQKVKEMHESIKHLPEYHELSAEVNSIEKALKQHGFQMATRLVVVAKCGE